MVCLLFDSYYVRLNVKGIGGASVEEFAHVRWCG